MDTPGHARHHCCIWDPESRGIFSGDLFGQAYPYLQTNPDRPLLMPLTAPAAFEPDVMIASINRMLELHPEYLYLTHFGPVPAHPDSISRLIDLIQVHEDLAADDQKADPAAVTAKIQDVFYHAYCRMGTPHLSREEFCTFLAGDIELNTQGIIARQNRLLKKTGR